MVVCSLRHEQPLADLYLLLLSFLGTMSLRLLFFSLCSLTSLCILLSLFVLSLYSKLSLFSLALDVSISQLWFSFHRSLSFSYTLFFSLFFLFTIPLFLCLHLFLQPCRVTSLFVSAFTPKHTKKTHTKNNILKNIHTSHIHMYMYIFVNRSDYF